MIYNSWSFFYNCSTWLVAFSIIWNYGHK